MAKTKQELEALHPFVKLYIASWRFYKHAYEGTKALIELENVLPRHPREKVENYARRLDAAYGFGYSAAVVDLLNFYLFQQPSVEDWSTLETDKLFQMFLNDSDLYGTDFDVFLVEAQKAAAIQGHSGILVDKPTAQQPSEQEVDGVEVATPVVSQADVEDNAVYPYVSVYEATNILNWKYERDSFGRPFLAELTLLDTVEETDLLRYRVWTPQTWEIYIMSNGVVTLENSGQNPLNTIPFTWVINSQSSHRNIGISDLKEVGYIDASIIRNLSQAEEIVDYAAFPMMLKPMLPPGTEEDDTTGVTNVIEFDPDRPESMPKWMESKVKEPIDAILLVIAKKVEEIYRSVNAGGLQATEVSREAKSGVALQQEFRLLNAKLASKSSLLEEAEKQVINFWVKWENKDVPEDLVISRPRDFNISDLLTDLETAILSMSAVESDTYRKQIQKLIARRTLTERDDFSEIDTEIEEYEAPEIDASLPTQEEVDEEQANAQ